VPETAAFSLRHESDSTQSFGTRLLGVSRPLTLSAPDVPETIVSGTLNRR
jgi:hypothetical protein